MNNPVSLSSLATVALDASYTPILESAGRRMSGDPVWRRRKLSELRQFLALVQILPQRLKLLFMDVESDAMRLVVALHCPVPLRPRNGGPLRRADGDAAVLGIIYPREVLLGPLPGTRFIEILQPSDVFHPNVRGDRPQVMCMGATLPRGFPLTELLVLAYASLSCQQITVDRRDHAGILNVEASGWYEANPGTVPLTREPFFFRSEKCTCEGGEEGQQPRQEGNYDRHQ